MGDKSPRSKDKNKKQKQTAEKKSKAAMVKKQAPSEATLKGRGK